MALATGVGSFPGTGQQDFDEALRVVLGALGEWGLPFLPEVPGRGATADLVGRTLGLVGELDADLQPAGWRLTGTGGAPPVDQRRARSLLAQDLDTLEEQVGGYTRGFKVQVAGPWTLAATVERPRGDKVVADHGARRDLAQALAVAAADHVQDVRRRLPDADRIVLQVDEPALPAVLAGRIPTASGFGRHRVVHPPEASEAIGWVLEAVRDAGAEPWVHCCAPEAPLALLRGAGAVGLVVDLSVVDATGHDALAGALEAGETVALGVLPSTDPSTAPTDTEVVGSVRRWLDMLGLDPAAAAGRLVLSPTCGLGGASPEWARRALELAASAARIVEEA
ncbi:MAG TPA: methionine synthase [Nocardioides sp.]|nr:methionine synthase [Nocardioides sp.]